MNTTRRHDRHPPRPQAGAALVTALVFLAIVTTIALAAMRSSTQELRMSVNQELKVEALQRTQAISDAVSANPASTPVVGDVGHRICTPVVPAGHAPCDDYTLVVPPEATTPVTAAGDAFFVSVERLGSEQRPPPRGSGSSLASFGAAAFRVHSQYDGTDNRRGRADLYEGVLVLVPRN